MHTYTGKICYHNSKVSLKSLWVKEEKIAGQNVLFLFSVKLRYMLNRNRIPYTVIFAYGWKSKKMYFWYVYTNVQCKVGALSLMYGSHVQNREKRQVLPIFLIHFTVFFVVVEHLYKIWFALFRCFCVCRCCLAFWALFSCSTVSEFPPHFSSSCLHLVRSATPYIYLCCTRILVYTHTHIHQYFTFSYLLLFLTIHRCCRNTLTPRLSISIYLYFFLPSQKNKCCCFVNYCSSCSFEFLLVIL